MDGETRGVAAGLSEREARALASARCWAEAGRRAGRGGSGPRRGVGRMLGREKRAAGKKEKEAAGLTELGWISYFLSLSYFFSFQTSLKLIEFKLQFEFKPYALNQIRFMHQHECTNIFNLNKF